MNVCKRGHRYSGDENYRARHGRCPVCFQEVIARYNRSEKARATKKRYLETESAQAVKRRANARTNAHRIMIGGQYVGRCGFTVSETEAMLDGSTD